jgi:hypothetical protein
MVSSDIADTMNWGVGTMIGIGVTKMAMNKLGKIGSSPRRRRRKHAKK